MDRKSILHISTGAATVAVLGLLFLFGYRTPVAEGNAGYIVSAEFEAIDGISAGSTVVLAGMPVGRVSDVRLNPENNHPILGISLSDGIEIPYDSSIKIVSDGLAGAKYLKIVPGAEFEMLEPGDPFEYTQSSVLFEELLEKVIVGAEARRAAKQAAQEETQ